MADEAASIVVSLEILGRFDPDVVTHEINILPTVSWRKGDPSSAPLRPRESDGWAVGIRKRESTSLADDLRELLTRIPSRPAVAKLARERTLRVQIACVVYVTHAVPQMTLDPELLEALVELQATLDIDMYLVGE